MNSEQKAFYEYGSAHEMAAMINSYVRRHLRANGYRLTIALLHECRDGYPSFVEAIRDAWTKRAVCRRTCSQCQTYQNELKDSHKNIWCPYAEIYTNGKARCVGCPFFELKEGGGRRDEEE